MRVRNVKDAAYNSQTIVTTVQDTSIRLINIASMAALRTRLSLDVRYIVCAVARHGKASAAADGVVVFEGKHTSISSSSLACAAIDGVDISEWNSLSPRDVRELAHIGTVSMGTVWLSKDPVRDSDTARWAMEGPDCRCYPRIRRRTCSPPVQVLASTSYLTPSMFICIWFCSDARSAHKDMLLKAIIVYENHLLTTSTTPPKPIPAMFP